MLKAGLTASGAFGLALPGLLSNSVGAWSLGIELMFYLIVPLAVMAAARASPKALVGVVLGLTLAQQAYLALIAPIGDPVEHWNAYIVPLTFAPFFAIGFLVHKLGGTRRPMFLPLMLGGFVLIGAFSTVFSADVFRSAPAFLALMLLAAMTIYCANRSEVPAQLGKGSAFLGDISYALYLTHPFTEKAVDAVGSRLGLPLSVQGALFVIAAVLVSFAIFHLFERPMRDRLRSAPQKTRLQQLP